jgi:hypothetical protein
MLNLTENNPIIQFKLYLQVIVSHLIWIASTHPNSKLKNLGQTLTQTSYLQKT